MQEPRSPFRVVGHTWQAQVSATKNMWRVVRALPLGGWGPLTGLVAMTALQAALPAAMALVTRFLLRSVIRVLDARGDASGAANRQLALAIGISLAVFVGMRLIAVVHGPIQYLYIWQMLTRLKDRARRAALQPVGIGHLEESEVRNVLRSIGNGGAYSPPGAAVALLGLTALYVGSFGALVLLARFSPWMTVALIGAILVVRWRFAVEGRQLPSLAHAAWQEENLAEYRAGLVTHQSAAQEVRLFGLTDWLVEGFRAGFLRSREKSWAEHLRIARWSRGLFLVVGLVQALVLVLLVRAAVQARISIPDLGMYLTAAGAVVPMLSPSFATQQLQYGMGELDANEKVLAPLEAAASAPAAGTSVLDPALGDIVFESVSFHYPHAERMVLDRLDLTMPSGTSTAIVGSNGAGKSTLINLLTQMYAPSSGRILVGGVDLADVDADAWRSRIAAVFQDFCCYPLSLADNVGIAAQRSSWSEDEVLGPLTEAGLGDLADGLPSGLATRLGWASDDSVGLSGGQWQRLCIARALLAVDKGAQLLILDEPTANLDVRGELEVFDHIIERCQGASVLLVSHRFSTVRRADRILVVRHGRVVEQGSHGELMELGGRYARMFNLQASHIRGEASR